MKLATNLFGKGLVTDYDPLNCPNDILTDNLNGTLITMNGNERILQNDMGNTRIGEKELGIINIVKLKEGFIPVGVKEYGGIIYVASHNPETGLNEIGSFPSPSSDSRTIKNSGVSNLKSLANCVTTEKYEVFPGDYIYPGDSFLLYDAFSNDTLNNSLPIKYISNYNNTEDGKIKSPKNELYTLKLMVQDSEHNLIDITDLLKRYDENVNEFKEQDIWNENYKLEYKLNNGYFIKKYNSEESLTDEDYNIYQNKFSGKLFLVLSRNIVDHIDVNVETEYKECSTLIFEKDGNEYVKVGNTYYNVNADDKIDNSDDLKSKSISLYYLIFNVSYYYNCPDVTTEDNEWPSEPTKKNTPRKAKNINQFIIDIGDTIIPGADRSTGDTSSGGTTSGDTSGSDVINKGDTETHILVPIIDDTDLDIITTPITNDESYKDLTYFSEAISVKGNFEVKHGYPEYNEATKLYKYTISYEIPLQYVKNHPETVEANIAPRYKYFNYGTKQGNAIYKNLWNESTIHSILGCKFDFTSALSSILGYTITPYMLFEDKSLCALNSIAINGQINLSLLGSNTIDIHTWKYYVDDDYTRLVFGFQDYMDSNTTLKSVKVSMYKLTKIVNTTTESIKEPKSTTKTVNKRPSPDPDYTMTFDTSGTYTTVLENLEFGEIYYCYIDYTIENSLPISDLRLAVSNEKPESLDGVLWLNLTTIDTINIVEPCYFIYPSTINYKYEEDEEDKEISGTSIAETGYSYYHCKNPLRLTRVSNSKSENYLYSTRWLVNTKLYNDLVDILDFLNIDTANINKVQCNTEVSIIDRDTLVFDSAKDADDSNITDISAYTKESIITYSLNYTLSTKLSIDYNIYPKYIKAPATYDISIKYLDPYFESSAPLYTKNTNSLTLKPTIIVEDSGESQTKEVTFVNVFTSILEDLKYWSTTEESYDKLGLGCYIRLRTEGKNDWGEVFIVLRMNIQASHDDSARGEVIWSRGSDDSATYSIVPILSQTLSLNNGRTWDTVLSKLPSLFRFYWDVGSLQDSETLQWPAQLVWLCAKTKGGDVVVLNTAVARNMRTSEGLKLYIVDKPKTYNNDANGIEAYKNPKNIYIYNLNHSNTTSTLTNRHSNNLEFSYYNTKAKIETHDFNTMNKLNSFIVNARDTELLLFSYNAVSSYVIDTKAKELLLSGIEESMNSSVAKYGYIAEEKCKPFNIPIVDIHKNYIYNEGIMSEAPYSYFEYFEGDVYCKEDAYRYKIHSTGALQTVNGGHAKFELPRNASLRCIDSNLIFESGGYTILK